VNLKGAFANATHLVDVPQTIPASVEDISWLFSGATSFNQDIGDWCVKEVTYEQWMFREEATSWTKPIPEWGTCPQETI
jgi:hypothetical protein